MNKQPVLITTPIFYPNSNLHIGHTYTLLLADTLCKLLNVINIKAYLLTGLDEHGQKVYNSAQQNNTNITLWLQHHFDNLKNLCDNLRINVSIWSRTTNEVHEKYVQNIWNILYQNNDIYEGLYCGYYSEKDETFYDIKDLIDKNGVYYTADDTPTYYLEEPCWYLKLNKNIINTIVKNLHVTPHIKLNELIKFVESENLQDLCISRKSGWGIKVPTKHIKFNQEGDVIYVWFDALINYISQFNQINTNLSNNMIHVLGKDIFKFHGVYWPYLLHQTNHTHMPRLLVHNWWIMNDKKMSKSFGNILLPQQLIDKYGYVAIRFYFIYNDLVSGDQTFNEIEVAAKFNQFIVDKFANLLYRTWILLNKNNITEHIPLQTHIDIIAVERHIIELNVKGALMSLFDICNDLNARFDREKAWLPENIDSVINIASNLKCLLPYFHAILSDDRLINIDFASTAFHIYKRFEI